MSTIKDRNGRDLLDTKEIKKRWRQYTKELYKKDLHKLDYYDSVWSVTQSKIFWSVKSSGPKEALLI